MPYTPPSPSPTASLSHSRASSRSSSISTPSTTFSELAVVSPGAITKSASYLNKQRRSQPGRIGVKVDRLSLHERNHSTTLAPPRPSASLHQAPSPVNNGTMIPTGAVMSPPDSSQNSSDDETRPDSKKRGRQLVNLAELEEAIRSIPQRKQPSPERNQQVEDGHVSDPKSPEMLSAAIHNKITHSRSSSDSGMRDFGRALQEGDDSDEETNPNFVAPPMVRKKSGELVKSSLKAPGLSRRPSSMPSTPTYPKAVHFDAHLEHVRHFLQAEKPLAVSAGSSPVESAIELENEYPFPITEYRQPHFDWDLSLPNFPEISVDRDSWVVRVEKVALSHDSKNLLGTVAVANLAFHKFVVARFTMDYWQTTSEVVAEFNNDVRRKQREDGYDRFTFKIRLEDQHNLENKTLFFCVRYRVNDQEYWDNNSSINYQVDFRKKAVPQNGKGLSSRFTLPRSRPSASSNRPKSMPIFDDGFDAFDIGKGSKYPSYGHKMELAMSNEPRPRVKIAPPASDIDETEAPARRANPSGNAFGNRYDFEASLAAAITTAAKSLGPERSDYYAQSSPRVGNEKVQPINPYSRMGSLGLTRNSLPRSHSSPALSPAPKKVQMTIPRLELKTPSPEPITTPGLSKNVDKPSIESSSYRELLDNYCFFGSAKALPSPATAPQRPAKSSAVSDGLVVTDSSSTLSLPQTHSPAISPSLMSDASQQATKPSASTSSSRSGSQKSSRSPSPINSGYGFPSTHTVSFDALVSPKAIHT